MSRTATELIANVEQHLRVLHEHVARGDMEDETIFDAVCMRLSAAIESLGAIDDGLREQRSARPGRRFGASEVGSPAATSSSTDRSS